MTCRVFVLVEDQSDPVQISAVWASLGDAAGDIDGGDFWDEVNKRFPDGCNVKEVRLVPDKPIKVKP